MTKRTMLIVVVALMAPIAPLTVASPAMAAPKGIFKAFANCPLKAIKELGAPTGETLCQFGEITSGEFAIGAIKVPITNTITLTGGAIRTGNPENEDELFLLPGANGESLSNTELNVPGGLPSLVNCREIKGNGNWGMIKRGTCKAFVKNKTTEMTATVEIVANAHNPVIFNFGAFVREEGAAITLPARVHLKNQLLGNACYIGSEASPIQLHLTTGATSPKPPNKSIRGARGTPETLEEGELLMLRLGGSSLVDNAFSAPAAEGCGEFFSFLIDPLIDAKLKLPSEDGNNTAVLNGTLNIATAEAVEASE